MGELMQCVGVIERASQRVDDSGTLKEFKAKLSREGYTSVEAHLAGAQIRRDLKLRMSANSMEPKP